jgi:hypothetical protein
LRQAQEEAAAELATYRAQREDQFKRLVASVRIRSQPLRTHASRCCYPLAHATPARSKRATPATPWRSWRRTACG